MYEQVVFLGLLIYSNFSSKVNPNHKIHRLSWEKSIGGAVLPSEGSNKLIAYELGFAHVTARVSPAAASHKPGALDLDRSFWRGFSDAVKPRWSPLALTLKRTIPGNECGDDVWNDRGCIHSLTILLRMKRRVVF
jgi:hypothetical protein